MFVSGITGHLVLIMAPTGSGKGFLISHIQQVFPQVTRTVSCTTRSIRPGEIEGREYYFITRDVFERKINHGEFIEWAEYGGELYGTLVTELVERLTQGQVVICEIEVQGIHQLMTCIAPTQRTIVYIDAGVWESLQRRARARAPIHDDALALRYKRYQIEVAEKDIADVVIYNRDGEQEQAKKQLEKIIQKILITIAK